jgi:lipopolysaccharide biosynthesis protein
MFWYRPAALRPLMDVEKFDKQFLPEPLPHTNAFPHSFEGIVVYVAWSQNFDFRVVLNKEAVFSGFDVHNKTGINDLTESFFKTSAWKIGRSITWVPWKIKRFFRGKIDTPNDFPESK